MSLIKVGHCNSVYYVFPCEMNKHIKFTYLSMNRLGLLQHRYTSDPKIGLEKWCQMGYNAGSKFWKLAY